MPITVDTNILPTCLVQFGWMKNLFIIKSWKDKLQNEKERKRLIMMSICCMLVVQKISMAVDQDQALRVEL